MDAYYIIAFDSTHHAISAEQLLGEEERDMMMIPTPREISSSCGLSIKIGQGGIQPVMIKLKEKKMLYHGIFRVESQQGKRIFFRIDEGDCYGLDSR